MNYLAELGRDRAFVIHLSDALADFNKTLSLDATLVGAGAGPKRVGGPTVASVRSENMIEAGRALVREACSGCHATRTGSSPHPTAPTFRDVKVRYPILTLRDPVSRGIAFPHREMPSFALSGDQVDSIIAYINTLPASRR